MSDSTDRRVGLLGTGLMGTAMAHRLLDQGVAVIAWDRDPNHVQPLAARGAEVAGTASEVVSGAHAVITMLPTAEIVLAVVEPLLDEWPEETIWLQMSSVGAAEADRLVEVATAHDVTLFDAPVSGSTHPAEEGQLTILASGPNSGRDRAQPVFEALGSRVQWVGQAGMGSRLKLAANHWMIAMVAALAETMHLCQLMSPSRAQQRPDVPPAPIPCSPNNRETAVFEASDRPPYGEPGGRHLAGPPPTALLGRRRRFARPHQEPAQPVAVA